MTIDEIYNLTESEAQALADDQMTFKGHNIYFANLGEYFKYSVLVYKNNHQIKYADDFELHHSGKTKEQLYKLYVRKCKKNLYTEKDFSKPLKSYDDYRSKADYLVNLYALQVDYVSMFGIFNTDEQIAEHKRKTKGLIADPVGHCYVKDEEFVKKHIELMEQLVTLKNEMEKSYDYIKTAFKHEMYNHEYAINWQADWDVLSVFGKVTYKDTSNALECYFNELNFTDDQRRAYKDARREYYKEIEKKGYY